MVSLQFSAVQFAASCNVKYNQGYRTGDPALATQDGWPTTCGTGQATQDMRDRTGDPGQVTQASGTGQMIQDRRPGTFEKFRAFVPRVPGLCSESPGTFEKFREFVAKVSGVSLWLPE